MIFCKSLGDFAKKFFLVSIGMTLLWILTVFVQSRFVQATQSRIMFTAGLVALMLPQEWARNRNSIAEYIGRGLGIIAFLCLAIVTVSRIA